jgi:hypothetical protein
LRRSSPTGLRLSQGFREPTRAGEAAVRIPRGEPLDVKIGQRAALICWGVMPSGMQRHMTDSKGHTSRARKTSWTPSRTTPGSQSPKPRRRR